MSSPPSPPANTTSQVQQTQTAEMDPKLYALLYGNPNAPGNLILANASQNAQILQGVQNSDPSAIRQFFGYTPTQAQYNALQGGAAFGPASAAMQGPTRSQQDLAAQQGHPLAPNPAQAPKIKQPEQNAACGGLMHLRGRT